MNQNTNFIISIGPVSEHSLYMQKIYKQKYLDFQIKNILNSYKRSKIIVVGSWEYLDSIISSRVKYLNYNSDQTSNIGTAIKKAIQMVNSSSLAIMNVEMFFDTEILGKTQIKNNSIIVNNNSAFKSKIGCTINNDRVNFVFYDLENKVCEFIYINQKSFDRCKAIVQNYVSNNMYLFEIINTLIEHDIEIQPYKINKNIYHLYNIKDLNKIRNCIKRTRPNVSV